MLVFCMLFSAASAFTTPFQPNYHLAKASASHSVSSSKLYSALSGDADVEASQSDANDDGDFHPSDAAVTTPEFLAGLWQLISRGNNMVRGVSTVVKYKYVFYIDSHIPSFFHAPGILYGLVSGYGR
jgi:hypothetical protein